jgi:hypothetical protein
MEIKTFSRGIRRGAGGFPCAVAHVAAAVLAVAAMLIASWAGPPASASAGTEPRATSPASAPVKFYIVPPPENGHAESLFTIAARTLGDGSQFMEIFNLNKGRLQPNGGRLTKPQLIEPGWILQLPADAAGPGVHFGPPPVVTAPTTHRSFRSAGTGSAIMISEALLALLTAGLAFGLIRRRASPARRRRLDRTPGPTSRACHDAGLLRVVVTGSPADDREGATGPGTGAHEVLHRPAEQPTAPAAPFRAQEPVRLANWIVLDADHQAAETRQQRPAEPAAPRQASEWDAAELRSALMEMRAELGQVASYIAGDHQSTALPMTAAAAQPETQSAAQPTVRRTAKQATWPAEPPPQPAESATRPAKRAAKPAGRPRQFRALRLTVLAMTIPILFCVTAATWELALHGYGFFVFRAAGVGATQQGPARPAPAQPPAAHHPDRPGTGQAGPRGARCQQNRDGHGP